MFPHSRLTSTIGYEAGSQSIRLWLDLCLAGLGFPFFVFFFEHSVLSRVGFFLDFEDLLSTQLLDVSEPHLKIQGALPDSPLHFLLVTQPNQTPDRSQYSIIQLLSILEDRNKRNSAQPFSFRAPLMSTFMMNMGPRQLMFSFGLRV